MTDQFEFATGNQTWLLYVKRLRLRQGILRDFYFFAKKGTKPNSGKASALPPGKVVGINERTGMPFLRNAR